MPQTLIIASMETQTAVVRCREYRGCNAVSFTTLKEKSMCWLKALPFHPDVGKLEAMSSARLCANGAASQALRAHAWYLQRALSAFL